MRDARKRLLDILEAIRQIEKYTSKGRDAFDEVELVQVWVLHHLQIIGEAASSLDAEVQAQYPQIPWSEMIGMRNILVHQYFETRLDIAWDVVTDDLPRLKGQIDAALENNELV